METRKQRYKKLVSQMKTERSSFEAHWRELAGFVKPNRARFLATDTTGGRGGLKKWDKVIDATGSFAARTLAAGMMSGITSPARPWFRLTTPDPDLAEFGPVKDWLHIVRRRILEIFSRSNYYARLQPVYGDLGVFATGAIAIVANDKTVIRTYDFPIGSYLIANDAELNVRVFAREFPMTVRQIVERFGKDGKFDNFSPMVRDAWNKGDYERWVDVTWIVQPNVYADASRLDAKYKPFSSCYYESGSAQASTAEGAMDDVFLEESGYDEFPILVPRWETAGEDVWGTDCPGMMALGDIKQLQQMEKRGAQGLDRMTNPPMVAAEGMRSAKLTTLPGEVSYVDETSDKKFRPALDLNIPLQALEEKEDRKRELIRRHFHEDLFLMLEMLDRKEITATEIMERKEEKLLVLGPVLEQLNPDLLKPSVDRTFNEMARRNMLPPPPPDLQGIELQVEFDSILSQAQKSVGIASVERLTTYVATIAEAKQDPTVFDKLDVDQAIEEYGDMAGVPPRMIRPEAEVAQLRDQRAKQQQAAQQAELAAKVAPALKQLSETNTRNPSALADLIGGGAAGNTDGLTQ